MMSGISPGGAASGAGAAGIATCTCSLHAFSAGSLGFAGAAVAPLNLQAGVVLIFVALLVGGLFTRGRRAGVTALAGLGVLGAAYLLAPPAIMTTSAMPYSGAEISGLLLYLPGAVLFVMAFRAGFAALRTAAGTTAAAGFAVAAGCGCCVVNGALTGLGRTAGAPVSGDVFLAAGMSLAAVGLARLAGARPAGLVVAGAAIAWGAPQVGDFFLGDSPVALSVALRYAGWLVVAGGFANAIQMASADEPEAALGTGGLPASGPETAPATS